MEVGEIERKKLKECAKITPHQLSRYLRSFNVSLMSATSEAENIKIGYTFETASAFTELSSSNKNWI